MQRVPRGHCWRQRPCGRCARGHPGAAAAPPLRRRRTGCLPSLTQDGMPSEWATGCLNPLAGDRYFEAGGTGEPDMSETPIPVREPPAFRGPSCLTIEVLALLQYRVATAYYDDIRVIDSVARTLLKGMMHLS